MKKFFYPLLMMVVTILIVQSCANEPRMADPKPQQVNEFLDDVNCLSDIDETLVDPTRDCGDAYEPVCICETMTLANPCEAEKAGYANYTTGPCHNAICINEEYGQAAQEFPCQDVVLPVCGCDNVTYSNYCEAMKAGVTTFSPGQCATDFLDCYKPDLTDPLRVCPPLVEPVCVCERLEFINGCEAEKAGFYEYADGECPDDVECKVPVAIQPNVACVSVYQPVCGCDGHQYPNSCAAIMGGVLVFTPCYDVIDGNCICPEL